MSVWNDNILFPEAFRVAVEIKTFRNAIKIRRYWKNALWIPDFREKYHGFKQKILDGGNTYKVLKHLRKQLFIYASRKRFYTYDQAVNHQLLISSSHAQCSPITTKRTYRSYFLFTFTTSFSSNLSSTKLELSH